MAMTATTFAIQWTQAETTSDDITSGSSRRLGFPFILAIIIASVNIVCGMFVLLEMRTLFYRIAARWQVSG